MAIATILPEDEEMGNSDSMGEVTVNMSENPALPLSSSVDFSDFTVDSS